MPCMPHLGYKEHEINAMWVLIMQDWCHCESIESHLVATLAHNGPHSGFRMKLGRDRECRLMSQGEGFSKDCLWIRVSACGCQAFSAPIAEGG